jgi:hypothetical protein
LARDQHVTRPQRAAAMAAELAEREGRGAAEEGGDFEATGDQDVDAQAAPSAVPTSSVAPAATSIGA